MVTSAVRLKLSALQGDPGFRLGPRRRHLPPPMGLQIDDLDSLERLAEMGFQWDSPRGILVRRVEFPVKALHLSVDRLEWQSLRGLSATVPTGGPLSLLSFDLETTGLQRGTGTVPFLYGWASLSGDCAAVVLEQWLLPDLGQEQPLVRAALDRMRDASLLITYNGSSYDLPMLKSRMVMAGVDRAWPATPHLDLLPVVRRLFRHRMERCTLRAVEQRLLHQQREGDLPGREAPERYWRFLETRDPEPLQDVINHNQQDVLSLLGVLERLARHLELDGPLPTDWLSLGRFIEERGDLEGAGAAYLRAEAVSPSPLDRAAALRRGRLLRRQGRSLEAIEVWRTIWERWQDPEAAEAICVDQEHRQRDLEAALQTARAALREAPVGWDQRFARRIWRLQARLGPSAGASPPLRSLNVEREADRPWVGWLPGGESYEAWLALRRGRRVSRVSRGPQSEVRVG
ncbi:MAG: ribonuclease H-like domain-containing protein [Candidatus Dormibacteria bacterium]